MANALEYQKEKQTHEKCNLSALFTFKMIQNSMMKSGTKILNNL